MNLIKPNKAVGLDKVSSRLLKDAADIVAPSLTSLYLISLQILAVFRPHGNLQRYLLFSKTGVNRILPITDRFRYYPLLLNY